ncbi:hypothetical protein [Streptomyces sp. NPDC050738]|uniref:hypothetical protein n=1 Tax=Streptomyces sp. NPDC050738 TaxID=3154744 RepID=UPI00341ED70C
MLLRRVKFGAVLVAVVLALTGFSSKKHGHSSGGGGCHSSKSRTTHHDYDDDDNYNSSSSGGSTYRSTPTPTPTPTPSASAEDSATVISCVQKADTKAAVKVTVRQRSEDKYGDSVRYRVRMVFRSASGGVVDRGAATLDVRFPGGAGVLMVPMGTPSKAGQVATCAVESLERVG